MSLTEQIESYRFWELVNLLAQEQSLNEDIVARALVTAVVRDGVLMNSVDPKWLKVNKGDLEMKGEPYVGYCSTPGDEVMVLKSNVLEHLLAVVRQGAPVSKAVIQQEFVKKEDFRQWALCTDQALPYFWFS